MIKEISPQIAWRLYHYERRSGHAFVIVSYDAENIRLKCYQCQYGMRIVIPSLTQYNDIKFGEVHCDDVDIEALLDIAVGPRAQLDGESIIHPG